jgi:hypothetical protein
MQRSEYLANLQLATSTERPSWTQPSRTPRRPTRVAQPKVRIGFIAALAWACTLYVGCYGMPL